MCVTDPWSHMSLVHSILSLKLVVTETLLCDVFSPSEWNLEFVNWISCTAPIGTNWVPASSRLSLQLLYLI